MAANASPQSSGLTPGLFSFLKSDAISGFLVFLIALPLCLAISKASGCPPIAGIITAVVGGLICPWISNSELTIKGPAAGLIVIVAGCVADFGGTLGNDLNADMNAYQCTLAVGAAAAVIQIVLGLCRAGVLGELFPSAAVHGLLAAIGIIIISKQLPVALGEVPKGEPLELLASIPHQLMHLNPEIATIGGVSLLLLFLWPLIPFRLLRIIPAPLIVLALAIGLGVYFDLAHQHNYNVFGHQFTVDATFLVDLPNNIASAIVFPKFEALREAKAWYWVAMFAIIGSLESMLSAKAVDLIDPLKRKTDLNRDVLAVGVANLAAAAIGGIPMISEIVRSRANVDNGGRTRLANAFHGLFLVAFVALLPNVIEMIPLAALAAMLVYTGFRLAHPRAFVHIYRIGREQLVVFVGTIIAVLATDLLVGILIGVAIKLLILFINGVPLMSLIIPHNDVTEVSDTEVIITPRHSAVFSNWIMLRRQIEIHGLQQRRGVTVDLSRAQIVDSTVMNQLLAMQTEYRDQGLVLDIVGLDAHFVLSDHATATRVRGRARGVVM
jgi:MFS superfamily sulfate permease-like transporter